MKRGERRILYFETSREAYDASQTGLAWVPGVDEGDGEEVEVVNGDILVVRSEGVVGVCDTWPTCVTEHTGALHGIVRMEFLADRLSGVSARDVRAAIQVARELLLPVARVVELWEFPNAG